MYFFCFFDSGTFLLKVFSLVNDTFIYRYNWIKVKGMGREFSDDFRIMIVKLHLEQGRKIVHLAKEYGVSESTIGRWITKYRNTLAKVGNNNRSLKK